MGLTKLLSSSDQIQPLAQAGPPAEAESPRNCCCRGCPAARGPTSGPRLYTWALFLQSRAPGDALGCSCAGAGRLRPAGGARGRAGRRERAEAARARAHPAAPGQYPARWGRCPRRCRPRAAQPWPPGPRVGPAPRCTAHGPRGRWSEYPATRPPPPQAPNGGPGGDAGRPSPAAKGRDRAGPRAPGPVLNQSGGNGDGDGPGLHPHIACRMRRRGAHACATLHPSWATCGWAPPESLRDLGSSGDPSSKARVLPASPPPASASRSWSFGRSLLRAALLVASPGSADSGQNRFRPVRCGPEWPRAGEVDFRGELGGRFPVRGSNLISSFPSKNAPPPRQEKGGGPGGVTQRG